jgi:hypothetical protein
MAYINVGNGWTAVGYHYGLIVEAKPDIGTALWHPYLGVFSVGPDGAQQKGLFAKFDNDAHR